MIKYTDGYWKDVACVSKHIPEVEKIFGKSVLITGATGLICSAVAEVLFYLNKYCGANVTIYLAGRNKEKLRDRFHGFEEGKDYNFVLYDATQNKLLSIGTAVDYLIHGASNAHPQVYNNEPVETMLGNLLGLNTLMGLAVQMKSTRLLYISSSEVYGQKEESRLRPYRETDYGFIDILNKRACYPNAKRAAETLCVAYWQEYGIETVMVRPGHIYGPTITTADSRASAQFIRNAFRRENIVMKSAGTQLRSYCYMLDCASAILTVLLNGQAGEAYNISNKNSIVSIRELADALAQVASSEVIFENPSDAEKVGYNMMDNSALDAAKLEQLGWEACFDLETGAECSVKYFCESE